MSFSWTIEGTQGEDLLKEFQINGQALGLGEDQVNSTEMIRQSFALYKYGEDYALAARDAVEEVQALVRANLEYWEGSEHDCPCCTCPKTRKPKVFGFDTEQAKRFVSIPLDRVKSAHGGW